MWSLCPPLRPRCFAQYPPIHSSSAATQPWPRRLPNSSSSSTRIWTAEASHVLLHLRLTFSQDHDAMSVADQTSLPRLCSLPRELFVEVVSYLPKPSLKALRLAIVPRYGSGDDDDYDDTRQWRDQAIVARLFYSVRLSRLKANRHNFLSITSRPHLAVAVTVLTWREYPDNVVEHGWKRSTDAASSSAHKTLSRVSRCSHQCAKSDEEHRHIRDTVGRAPPRTRLRL